jgi:hypothetical protein
LKYNDGEDRKKPPPVYSGGPFMARYRYEVADRIGKRLSSS